MQILVLVFGVFITLLGLGEGKPQYEPFIKTNSSRPHHSRLNDHPDSRQNQHGRHPHSSSSTVLTNSGKLRGIKRTVMGKDVHVFYGVPFAKPPLGDLRFKKPVPIEAWNGTKDATHQPNTCFQEVSVSFPGFRGEITWLPTTEISEDCLYMNIWVPKPSKKQHPEHPQKKMSILVWFYGGGYVSGTATLDIYNADILAAENNVIVVVPQYRVGAFGFLYFGQEDAPGNMGLYDQTVAIQWIKDNAASFGGDSNSITIFGESAGGGSVTLHLLSPISRHLINRGIIQSGTINAPWSLHTAKKARQIADKLVSDCNCTKSSEGTDLSIPHRIKCLREMSAQQISSIQWNSYKAIMQFFSAPTIDGVFLPKDPMVMLKEGNFTKVPLLFGSNKDEGSYFMLYDFLTNVNHNFTKDGSNCMSRDLFLATVEEVFEDLSTAQKEAIRFQYTHWEDPTDSCKNRDKFVEFVGDYYFICPTNRFATLYADKAGPEAPVYYYFFTQRTSSNPWGEWMGVMHADEIEYVFGHPINNSREHSEAEKNLSRRIMKYFTTFAETGNPVAEDSSETWPLYTSGKPSYYILNANMTGTGNGPRANTCAFWNFLPTIAPEPGDCRKLLAEISSAPGTSKISHFLLLLLILLATST